MRLTPVSFVLSLLIGAHLAGAGEPVPTSETPNNPPTERILDLAGTWQFRLDPENLGVGKKWFTERLDDTVTLPGTTDTNHKGVFKDERAIDRLSRVWFWKGPAWYQRQVTIPDAWKGKRITLLLERTKNTRVWVDATDCGADDTLSAPQVFDLSTALTPGTHTLTVLVDNAKLPPVGPAHAVDERTQTNWNGIIGKIELRATDPVWIEDVQVYPNAAEKQARVRVVIGNLTGQAATAKLEGSCRSYNVANPADFAAQPVDLQLPDARHAIEFTYHLGQTVPLWDEFQPAMLRLSLRLTATAGGQSFSDQSSANFGMRDFKRDGQRLTVNGRTVFLRGRLDCANYPLTGYAPMDKSDWLGVFGILKDWGLNHVRFHSWCPPEAAFEAADELGFYLQPEYPNKRSAFKAPESSDATKRNIDYLEVPGAAPNASLYDYAVRESELIFRRFGNHPSFVMFTLGNELGRNPAMAELVACFKQRDPRHLYAQGSNNNHWQPSYAEGDDFWVTGKTGKQLPVRGAFYHGDFTGGGHIYSHPPTTMLNYHDSIKEVPVPVISHEIGEFQVTPDFREIPKYTGVLKARNLETFQQRLKDATMLDLSHDFMRASGALAAICQREEIEAALRTPELGGFHLLDLQDFPGQGTALVGMLNVFMESKGIITPADRRQYCSETVPLLVMEKYTWTTDETFTGEFKIAHFGANDLPNARLSWNLMDGASIVTSGTFDPQTVRTGGLHSGGKIQISLANLKAPNRLKLNLAIEGTDSHNAYDLWIYPPKVDTAKPKDVWVADRYDAAVQKVLAEGDKVLLFPQRDDLKHSVGGAFPTDFWCWPMFAKGAIAQGLEPAPGTQGFICDPKHPALAEFPSEFHSNWQWWQIAKHSRPIILDESPADYRPIIHVMDNFARNHKLGLLFETKVGNGKLLVCASDLPALQEHPEARQLMHSLLRYVDSPSFAPQTELDGKLLEKLLAGDARDQDDKAISAAPPKVPARALDQLNPEEFLSPPVNARPGAFWDWLNGSITKDQITRDLTAMKQGGMRGAEIWDVAAAADPDKRVPAGPAFLGPESTRLIVHAIHEADRLDLEIGIVASSGWNAGGSWIPPEHAGKGLYQSLTRVAGPTILHAALPLPELPKRCPRDANGQPLYLREVAVLAVPHDPSKAIASASQVVDLTKHVDASGKLRWEVPAGDWDILRFVTTNHGQQLIVPSPNSGGPMIDFFDPRATEFHLRHIVTTILHELGRKTFEGTSFKTLEFDSMELDGFTPWSEKMADEFYRRVGYPVTRFLPLLAGWTLADDAATQQFLYDWRKLVSDLLIDSHYVTGRKFLEPYGVKLIAESGGPGPPIWASNPVDGIKALGAVDIPRGEFWNRHRGIFLVKEIASAAHVYDKRLVDAESFTTWRRWIDGPLNHKALADRALCEGLNCFSLHTFASSPPEAGLPGWAYHAGTDINPAATWWPMAHGLMDYLARCSYMLRQGWFVADVCYYYGDQAPNFYPPLCNVPEKPLLEGLDPRHDYDVCSSEVILERMHVEAGRIVLPDGMSYAALVLPEQDHIPAAVLAKIHALVADGATVIGHQRPTRTPGMSDRETESKKAAAEVGALWGPASDQTNPSPIPVRQIGKGRFLIARDRTAALRNIGIAGDFEVVGHHDGGLGPFDFVHRKTIADEIYFIRNKTREPQSLTCRFRVAAEASGLVPEFWWPDSGRRSACHGWKNVGGGQTELPVALGPLASVFVVFRKADAALDLIARDSFVAADPPALLAINGPWQVEFPEGWGAPRDVRFEKLQSWTESEVEGIRHFSGIATYRKTIDLPASLTKQERLFLELGDLAEIAEVTLNGKCLGLAWLPPYRIEISGAVHVGTNQLEIRVANLWANRLNGDSLLPETKRFTRSNLDRIQTDPTSDSSYGRVPMGKSRPVYESMPPLMKSGLFGPVRIITPKAATSTQ